MWRCFVYQSNVIWNSVVWFTIAVGTIGFACLLLQVDPPADAEIKYPEKLASLQAVLWMALTVQGFYLPYLASLAAWHTRDSGLLEWWIAGGISPWRIVLGQSLAILTMAMAYLLFVLTPLIAWLSGEKEGIPWRLVVEHHLLFLVSGEILILLTFFLAATWRGFMAYLGSVSIWGLSILGGQFVTEWLQLGANPWRLAGRWLWEFCPRFDLFSRPLSLIYHWNALPVWMFLELVGYGLIYGAVLLMGCEFFFRPRYAN